MTVGFKYYAKGASVPGSFTNIEVNECEIRDIWKTYDDEESLDGVKSSYKRRYKRAFVSFHKPYDSTIYSTLLNLCNSYYIRIDDSRFTSTNAIDFVFDGEPDVSRLGASRVLETLSITLISESPQ